MEEPVRIADDNDFASLKRLVDNDDGWQLELSKVKTIVWTRTIPGCNFQMVKIICSFDDIDPDCVFDVLLDPEYRKVWDSHMLQSYDIGNLNVNNDVGYYSMSCPPPLKPRDFVLLRSWLDTGPQGEQMLLSRSVVHKDYPPMKGYVRAMSHITGFVVRPQRNGGCRLGYIAHCDPQGALPPWLVNKVTHSLGPRVVNDLRKASLGYKKWKTTQSHDRKPWRFPEQMISPRISILDFQVQTKSNVLPIAGTPKRNSIAGTLKKAVLPVGSPSTTPVESPTKPRLLPATPDTPSPKKEEKAKKKFRNSLRKFRLKAQEK